MILKIRKWGAGTALVLALGLVIFLNNIGGANTPPIHTFDNIPMPQLADPLLIYTPANEIFNIASCSTNDMGFAIAQAQIPPGGGPMPHVHYFINEWFWMPEGGIQLFHSTRQYPDREHLPTINDAGRADLYSISSQPKQLIYSPNHYVHGFVNPTDQTLPITFVWLRNEVAPAFSYQDGGMREYFEAVGPRITDLNNLPELTNAQKAAFASEAPKYGINQSHYFMEYINSISNQLPAEIASLTNDQDLDKIVKVINAFNRGDQSVKCS
ncbi:periplasmic protein, function unknown [[Synechococcus] sp. NIES-970]|nr:periplasmic protein, function unknown [[Synechococcus] sp. NIES-970]